MNDILHNLQEAKAEGVIIDRLEAALKGVPDDKAILALSAMINSAIIEICEGNPDMSIALWKVQTARSLEFLQRMLKIGPNAPECLPETQDPPVH